MLHGDWCVLGEFWVSCWSSSSVEMPCRHSHRCVRSTQTRNTHRTRFWRKATFLFLRPVAKLSSKASFCELATLSSCWRVCLPGAMADLNLSKAERRQLFGRNAMPSQSQVRTFNTDEEYAKASFCELATLSSCWRVCLPGAMARTGLCCAPASSINQSYIVLGQHCQ
jgi:hypothetical protein